MSPPVLKMYATPRSKVAPAATSTGEFSPPPRVMSPDHTQECGASAQIIVMALFIRLRRYGLAMKFSKPSGAVKSPAERRRPSIVEDSAKAEAVEVVGTSRRQLERPREPIFCVLWEIVCCVLCVVCCVWVLCWRHFYNE